MSAEAATLVPPARHALWTRARRVLSVVVPLALAVISFELLRRQLEEHSVAEVVAGIREIPVVGLFEAVGVTGLAFVILTGYDRIALRHIRSAVPYRRSAPISLIAFGIGNALGLPVFTSMPLRFRLYSAAGLRASEVVQVIALTVLGSWLGLLALGGSVALLRGRALAELAGLPVLGIHLTGSVALGLAVAYLVVAASVRKPVGLKRWQFTVPTLRLASVQVLIAALDWTFAGLVLYALLPRGAELSFATFLGAYLIAQTVAMVSHVPGGLGVFEVTMVSLLATKVDAGDAAAALLVFRLVYYLLPLAGALVLLLALERRAIALAYEGVESRTAPLLGPVVPRALSLASFAAGAFLLMTGSLPAADARIAALGRLVPLGFIETSHLVASIAGLCLLVLSRGLARRLDGAWHATVWMLVVALASTLLRGLDYVEAGAVALVLVSLLLSRRHFHRRASLLSRPFSPRWVLGVGLVLAASLWLGLLVYGERAYDQDLLWRFSLSSDVPRFLRVQVALGAAVLVLGLLRLFRGAAPDLPPASAEELEQVERIIALSKTTTANLALLGDKRFLFSADRHGFIMFGISGDSWISMGDPVGDPDEFPDLIWRFRETCDRYDERPVFYQVRPQHLPLYLESGLSVIKLGEAAHIPLTDFSLEGSHRRDFRQRLRKAEKESLTFEVVPAERVPAILPELRAISDEWLDDKAASEKGFSLGAFAPEYLRHFPAAVVKRGDEILAFANVLVSAENEELSVDLMRYCGAAPPGVMDYLFVQLMLWGHDAGFRRFHLGMAPLSGLEEHALAPTWNRLGAWLFRHGEHFYNFRGLRDYKEKFSPEWEPRYLAAPDGLATSQALFDVARLISGGLVGMVRR